MTAPAHHVTFRAARRDDLTEIVRLLADDDLGQTRERYEDPLPDAYVTAFAAIEADARNELVVAEQDAQVVGCLQLTFMPSLTLQGGERMQIEGVRVDRRWRGHGIGEAMFGWAIERARARGCRLVQLTTNQVRPEAQHFYEQLGFEPTHVGFKLYLSRSG